MAADDNCTVLAAWEILRNSRGLLEARSSMRVSRSEHPVRNWLALVSAREPSKPGRVGVTGIVWGKGTPFLPLKVLKTHLGFPAQWKCGGRCRAACACSLRYYACKRGQGGHTDGHAPVC